MARGLKSRFARSLLAVFLAAVASACATGASARRAELRHGLDRAVISRSPAEIWPEVLRFLSQRGYPLVGADRLAAGKPAQTFVSKLFSSGFATRGGPDGGRALETDALKDTRVRVEATPVAGGGSRLYVRLVKPVEMSLTESTLSRDEDLELALLKYVDPAVAASITGHQAPAAPTSTTRASVADRQSPAVPAVSPLASAPAAQASTPTPKAASTDPWLRFRPLLGSWNGKLADGTAVHWRFDLVNDARLVEMHGTSLLFAGTAVRASAGEETGRISHAPDGDRLVWNQLTNAGKVDRYEADASVDQAADQPIVFVAHSPESLAAGARARLTIGRIGDQGEQIEAALDIAEPGKDFCPAATVRLTRAP
jgi:hypothetical protein